MANSNSAIVTTIATLTETIRAEERAKLEAEYATKFASIIGVATTSAIAAAAAPVAPVGTPVTPKRGRGRPLGSKNKPKAAPVLLDASERGAKAAFIRACLAEKMYEPTEIVAAGKEAGIIFTYTYAFQMTQAHLNELEAKKAARAAKKAAK